MLRTFSLVTYLPMSEFLKNTLSSVLSFELFKIEFNTNASEGCNSSSTKIPSRF